MCILVEVNIRRGNRGRKDELGIPSNIQAAHHARISETLDYGTSDGSEYSFWRKILCTLLYVEWSK